MLKHTLYSYIAAPVPAPPFIRPTVMNTVDDLLRTTLDRIAARRRLPESTYRLQFHAGFTFRDATAIVPYLRDLGVTHAYASPYLKAKPGSTHGYDVIDHCRLNPEVGTDAEYGAWLRALADHGLSHILDTVPNHVGVATNDNRWWNEVLENGPASPYGAYFDIAWRGSPRPELHDKVLIPTLGGPYADVLEKGELKLAFDNGAFAVSYYERRFPISPATYPKILGHGTDDLTRTLGGDEQAAREYREILSAAAGGGDGTAVKQRLAALAGRSEPVRRLLDRTVAAFNGTPGDPHSFDRLDDLLSRQYYRLAYWRVASDEINYRRFFDINDLAALAMERAEVFEGAHELILRLLGDGKIGGLRIDHPDGLYDPRQYFLRLQRHYVLACARAVYESDERFRGRDWSDLRPTLLERLAARLPDDGSATPDWPLYVSVEKILAPGEPLPDDWAVDGTSGYDFLVTANGLFVDGANSDAFTRVYHEWTGDNTRFADLTYRKKLLILDVSLASELQMLTHRLDRLAQRDRHTRDFTHNGLRHALREVIACFPVYRSYVSDDGVGDADRRYVEAAVEQAIARNPKAEPSVFHFVRDAVLLKYPESFTDADKAEQRLFAGRFQQLTAPTTAKGIEDTSFYIYNRLVSLNEVGGEPGHFGTPPGAVHGYLRDRQQKWAYGLSPLSTHDTKRSEDVRARINVLSELPGEWADCVARWGRSNEPHRRTVGGSSAPDGNDEYLLYQTLIGAWPLEPHGPDEYATFVERIQAYMTKALREAKVRTSWVNPNEEYETAVRDFVTRVLDDQPANAFLQHVRPFQRRVSHLGMLNALSQTLLRLTAPGVPDTYQGTELWDFSLVDPDNRRPVDYPRRARMLTDLKARAEAAGSDRTTFARDLAAAKEDGRVKLYVTWQALRTRQEHPGLFSGGEYHPAEVIGNCQGHVFGFARRHAGRSAVVVVPRLMARLAPNPGDLPTGADVWRDTSVVLPDGIAAGAAFRNVFTGERVASSEDQGRAVLPISAALAQFPVALLMVDD